MTAKADYSEDEWAQLMQAPVTAGMLVIMADLHITSMAGETKGMYKGMVEKPAPESAQELVGSLLENIQAKADKKEKMEMPEIEGKDPAALTAELVHTLTDVAALVDAKCEFDEAAGYKQWLLGVAEMTAEAGREGGFLGVGAVRISDKEKAMMEQIARALGVA